jgi:hypothetical protein
MSRAGTGSNVVQRIESANAARLAGQTVTLSFYYKSTAGADSFSTFFYYANSADNFGGVTQIGSTQTIATPSTSWTRVSYTYTSISANAANGLAIYFSRGNGATSTTLITGIQLEVGSTATTFSRAGATIGGEFALCQRYYQEYGSAGYNYLATASASGGDINATIVFPVVMRIAPSASTNLTNANYLTNWKYEVAYIGNATKTGTVTVNTATTDTACIVAGTGATYSPSPNIFTILAGVGNVKLSAEL